MRHCIAALTASAFLMLGANAVAAASPFARAPALFTGAPAPFAHPPARNGGWISPQARKRQIVYVAVPAYGNNGEVRMYTLQGKLVGELTGMYDGPYAIAVDRHNDIYTLDNLGSTIDEYRFGETKPFRPTGFERFAYPSGRLGLRFGGLKGVSSIAVSGAVTD